ncbi:UDP-glucose 4-epimerase GalE [Siminovitchia sediminis]|uniref:UDP-glucose 4-epimerase n=1 Tax=Siminovitchia sediminis TaxID=1274353 RepID=A0ABW4KLR3_9BACI
MAILVTGGAGYIGSHTCVELLNAGYDVVVVDNFCNSNIESLKRVERICGKKLKVYRVDLLDEEKLARVFLENTIESVIHFAGLKAVGESVRMPLSYYHKNITSTVILCKVMSQFNIKRLVFSSSATVYGIPETCPITEDFPKYATNPYGRTKLMIEELLKDLYHSDHTWGIALLRYFNPIGAHESGWIGEDPKGVPNNLMPYITQVAVGKREMLQVFGNQYPTKDGTGVRDYIHVVDLAKGHLKALAKINSDAGVHSFNLGTGKGYSVLELVNAFERVTGISIPYQIAAPRDGDIAICYASPLKAYRELGWFAEKSIDDMCMDSWKWQSFNPQGYKEETSAHLKDSCLSIANMHKERGVKWKRPRTINP